MLPGRMEEKAVNTLEVPDQKRTVYHVHYEDTVRNDGFVEQRFSGNNANCCHQLQPQEMKCFSCSKNKVSFAQQVMYYRDTHVKSQLTLTLFIRMLIVFKLQTKADHFFLHIAYRSNSKFLQSIDGNRGSIYFAEKYQLFRKVENYKRYERFAWPNIA